MACSAQVRSGSLAMGQIEPGEMSARKFAHGVRNAVDEDGVRVIFVDTLNGYTERVRTP